MKTFDTFTKKQQKTYSSIHDLEHELMASIDPSTFVLNPKTVELREKINAL